jgi:hypothetical protein
VSFGHRVRFEKLWEIIEQKEGSKEITSLLWKREVSRKGKSR